MVVRERQKGRMWRWTRQSSSPSTGLSILKDLSRAFLLSHLGIGIFSSSPTSSHYLRADGFLIRFRDAATKSRPKRIKSQMDLIRRWSVDNLIFLLQLEISSTRNVSLHSRAADNSIPAKAFGKTRKSFTRTWEKYDVEYLFALSSSLRSCEVFSAGDERQKGRKSWERFFHPLRVLFLSFCLVISTATCDECCWLLDKNEKVGTWRKKKRRRLSQERKVWRKFNLSYVYVNAIIRAFFGAQSYVRWGRRRQQPSRIEM